MGLKSRDGPSGRVGWQFQTAGIIAGGALIRKSPAGHASVGIVSCSDSNHGRQEFGSNQPFLSILR